MKRLVLITTAMLAAASISTFAAKDVFQRTKPHVNVGTIGASEVTLWIHSTIILRGDGKASGQMQFSVLDGENFFYRVIDAEAIVSGDDVIGLDVTLSRVGAGGDDTGELDFVTIRRSSAIEECLIYDLVGANIHVETEGTIELLDPLTSGRGRSLDRPAFVVRSVRL